MIYIKWLLMVPVMLLVSLATLIFAPVLALLVENREGKLDNNTEYGYGYRLYSWLSWFQTPDNSIDGDKGWREEHWQWRYKLPKPLATYVGRIGWLWRNPGYGFGLITLYNYDAKVTYTDKTIIVKVDKYFQYRYTGYIGSKQLYCNFGWNIKGLAEAPAGTVETCTFAFSVRML